MLLFTYFLIHNTVADAKLAKTNNRLSTRVHPQEELVLTLRCLNKRNGLACRNFSSGCTTSNFENDVHFLKLERCFFSENCSLCYENISRVGKKMDNYRFEVDFATEMVTRCYMTRFMVNGIYVESHSLEPLL